MILAAPLVIPFAEIIGVSIAALGMSKATDEVNKYIEANPEQSMKIFQMIMPSQGIANILKNKSSDEEVEEDVEVEEVDTRDLTRAEKAKMMKELAKSGGGNMREKMKKGYEEIIQPGESDRELDDAEDRYDGGVEDAPKPKFDYKKFFKNRYADGGSIGIEVLFEEKKPRKNFFMGGPALEGPALGIYNSMSAYNSFTDQEIANAIKEAGYELPTADSGTTTPPDSSTPSVSANLGITDPQPYSAVDQREYNMDARNFGPGKKMEINPTALGMSFYDAEPKKSPEGFIAKTIDAFTSVPGKQLSQFRTPTGISPRGPSELGFMTKNIEGLPGLNRDMIRSQYDNYSQFFGRPSNFANARVPGKAGQLLNMAPYVGTAKRGLEAMFGPAGDKSLQSKYTVDGAGFGNTGARDEFGLATFNKKDGFLGLTGNTTRNYTDRMNERLGELDDFFGSRIEGFDINNLDDATLNKMSKINGFYTKQIQAYKQRTAVEKLNTQQKDSIDRKRQQDLEIAAKKRRDAAATIAAAEKAARERELARRQTIVDAQKATTGFTTSGGTGNYRSDRDHSGSGGYGGSDKRSADNRSSDLGFSDIRLKENVELIGKSPSNINIYRFNYKDNPTTYQGAMAHEVPWASVKHSNGYMMIDYNQIDVDFKKI